MRATATTGRPELGGTGERDPVHHEVPPEKLNRHQAAQPDAQSTAPMSEVTENYWQGRRDSVAECLPHATREAVEAFALRHFDRAESAAFLIAEQIERDRLLALREASYAVSTALDWSAQSRQPSHAELVQRRSVVV